jgi:hypothetical protein
MDQSDQGGGDQGGVTKDQLFAIAVLSSASIEHSAWHSVTDAQ